VIQSEPARYRYIAAQVTEKPAERRRELSEAARQYRRLKSLRRRKYRVPAKSAPVPRPGMIRGVKAARKRHENGNLNRVPQMG